MSKEIRINYHENMTKFYAGLGAVVLKVEGYFGRRNMNEEFYKAAHLFSRCLERRSYHNFMANEYMKLAYGTKHLN